MKTLRYGLLLIAQLGLMSMCVAADEQVPSSTDAQEQGKSAETIKVEAPAPAQLGCLAAASKAGKSCGNKIASLVVDVAEGTDTACGANVSDAAGVCYAQGKEKAEALLREAKTLGNSAYDQYNQKNTLVKDWLVTQVNASPIKSEAKTWIIGKLDETPRAAVAATTGAALLVTALTVYGITKAIKCMFASKTTKVE